MPNEMLPMSTWTPKDGQTYEIVDKDARDRITAIEQGGGGGGGSGTVKSVNNVAPDASGNVTLSIPDAVTEQDVAGWGFTKNAGTYTKPDSGIPASDLADGVIPDISGKVDKITEYGLAKIAENEGNYNISVREGENAAINALVVSARTFATTAQRVSQALAAKANTADVYSKSELDTAIGIISTQLESKASKSDIASMYKFKGTVATVSTLPSSDQAVGDVYNVASTGMNYAWDGSGWDALGTAVDLSAYATEQWVGQQDYQTAQQVQTAIAAIPDELPTVTASDNGKFLRVVSGAWAAATVPAAENNSFGGGS